MGSIRSRAVYFTGPGNIEVRTEKLTSGAGDLVVESRLIGISHGTEMLFYNGPFPEGNDLESLSHLGGATGYPIKYGYMNVGVAQDGRRVFAFAPHQDHFLVSEDEILAIPESIGWDDAVLYPSVETAVQIVHDSAPRLGETVLVMGLGTIGTLVTRTLSTMGVSVIAADSVASRRVRAADAGCNVVDPGADDAVERILSLTRGVGPDVAINCSSSADALQLGLDTVAQEGLVVEASWYGSCRVSLDLGSRFHRKRIRMRSSQVSSLNPAMQPRWTRKRRTGLVWDLVGTLRPGTLITHRFSLDHAGDAFRLIDEGPDDMLQVVLEP